jgi:hypothetical protein
MDNRSFDNFTRHAAGAVSRRTTLVTLGLTALTALAGPFAADAKKGKKKKRKQNTSLAPAPAPLDCPAPPVNRCPAQADSCTAFLGLQCGGDPSCTAQVACCALLETCDAGSFWACLATA